MKTRLAEKKLREIVRSTGAVLSRHQLHKNFDLEHPDAFAATLKRLVAGGTLRSVTRGIYHVPDVVPWDGWGLERTAALLRYNELPIKAQCGHYPFGLGVSHFPRVRFFAYGIAPNRERQDKTRQEAIRAQGLRCCWRCCRSVIVGPWGLVAAADAAIFLRGRWSRTSSACQRRSALTANGSAALVRYR